MRHGVDVSRFQSPGAIPDDAAFVLARGSSGRSVDPSCVAHTAHARRIGALVGLYHFAIPTTPVAEQLGAYSRAADACAITAGDIIPFVDIEDFPVNGKWTDAGKVAPSWCEPLLELTSALARDWGACGVYITQRDWGRLGKPAWMVELPLWVAHWGTNSPATPGGAPWAIHQYRVGPWRPGAQHSTGEANQANPIDHNRAEKLPLIAAKQSVSSPGGTQLLQMEWFDDWREERDANVSDA